MSAAVFSTTLTKNTNYDILTRNARLGRSTNQQHIRQFARAFLTKHNGMVCTVTTFSDTVSLQNCVTNITNLWKNIEFINKWYEYATENWICEHLFTNMSWNMEFRNKRVHREVHVNVSGKQTFLYLTQRCNMPIFNVRYTMYTSYFHFPIHKYLYCSENTF